MRAEIRLTESKTKKMATNFQEHRPPRSFCIRHWLYWLEEFGLDRRRVARLAVTGFPAKVVM